MKALLLGKYSFCLLYNYISIKQVNLIKSNYARNEFTVGTFFCGKIYYITNSSKTKKANKQICFLECLIEREIIKINFQKKCAELHNVSHYIILKFCLFLLE